MKYIFEASKITPFISLLAPYFVFSNLFWVHDHLIDEVVDRLGIPNLSGFSFDEKAKTPLCRSISSPK